MCTAVMLQTTMDIRMIRAVRALGSAWADKVGSLAMCFSSVRPARNALVSHSKDETSSQSHTRWNSLPPDLAMHEIPPLGLGLKEVSGNTFHLSRTHSRV